MLLLFIVKTLDLEDVFLFFLDNIAVSIHYRGVMAITLSLPPTAPRTSLIVLVFFTSQVLIGRRLLEILAIRYVSKRSINRFIPSKVFFFFLYRLIPWGHFKSILQVFESDYNNAFTSILAVFSTTSSQKSSSWSKTFNYTRIEVFRLSWKYQIKISLFTVAVESNSYGGVTQLRTSSNWY